MRSSLLLRSLEITHYRAFDSLRLKSLGLVNLITGKNNVGKTCLLEALWVYAQRGAPDVLIELLGRRDEYRAADLQFLSAGTREEMPALRHMFHGRPELRERQEYFTVGPADDKENKLSVGVGWAAYEVDKDTGRHLRELDADELKTVERPSRVFLVRYGSHWRVMVPASQYEPRGTTPRFGPPPLQFEPRVPSIFIPANGLNSRLTAGLWDTVALTGLENDVLLGLQMIDPRVKRVSLIGEPRTGVPGRVPIVSLEGVGDPVPLRSLGEGMNRLFGLSLALANCRNGLLMVDEIDSGIHYSVQPKIWHLVFEMARRLTIQIFATTHSWDTIEAFQEAAAEHPEEGLLVRLQMRDDQVVPTLFSEAELAVATKQKIEVR